MDGMMAAPPGATRPIRIRPKSAVRQTGLGPALAEYALRSLSGVNARIGGGEVCLFNSFFAVWLKSSRELNSPVMLGAVPPPVVALLADGAAEMAGGLLRLDGGMMDAYLVTDLLAEGGPVKSPPPGVMLKTGVLETVTSLPFVEYLCVVGDSMLLSFGRGYWTFGQTLPLNLTGRGSLEARVAPRDVLGLFFGLDLHSANCMAVRHGLVWDAPRGKILRARINLVHGSARAVPAHTTDERPCRLRALAPMPAQLLGLDTMCRIVPRVDGEKTATLHLMVSGQCRIRLPLELEGGDNFPPAALPFAALSALLSFGWVELTPLRACDGTYAGWVKAGVSGRNAPAGCAWLAAAAG